MTVERHPASTSWRAAQSASEAIAAFTGAIVTQRLVLRPAQLDDAPALFVHYNDFDVIRWLARPNWPVSLPRLQDFVLRSMAAQSAGEMVYCAILVSGEPVGGVTWDLNDQGSHIGFWIGRAFWGRGYMSEAAAAMCDTVFSLSSETSIYSGVFEGNHASLAVQRKLGFIETGRSSVFCTPRGVELTHIDTKLTRTARRVVLKKANP